VFIVEFEERVKEIVREVVNSILNDKKSRKALLFITGGAVNINEIFNALSEIDGYAYDAVISESASNVIPETLLNSLRAEVITSKSQMTSVIKEANIILIPVLTRNTLAKAALGISDNLVTLGIQEAIMMGKKIVAVKDSCDPNEPVNVALGFTKNAAYNQMLLEYMKRLGNMGVTFIHSSQIKEFIGRAASEKKDEAVFKKKEVSGVVTRNDVSVMAEKGEPLYIKYGSVITPLAMDYIEDNGIEIRYIK
jgi:Flavoprotein.